MQSLSDLRRRIGSDPNVYRTDDLLPETLVDLIWNLVEDYKY